jgi:peptidoglycan/xylan/chitin deacetylase (PgdA/CDA1 family)
LAALACGACFLAGAPAIAATCANPNALGVSRTLVVDPSEHPRLGTMQYGETLPLKDHEVVLTFDDGPLPPYTGRILDILASECVKATYFLVGRMAQAYPKWVERIAAAGHTIGTHSQNHPLSFHKMKLERAEREINDGIASVKAALGHDPAPFFRIPGLLRVKRVEDYLASQHIMTWSADFPADDWKRISDQEILHRALARLEAHGRGILLLHDIHEKTVLALPALLHELKARGYRIVHVVPASPTLVATATLPEEWRKRSTHATAALPPTASATSAATAAAPAATTPSPAAAPKASVAMPDPAPTNSIAPSTPSTDRRGLAPSTRVAHATPASKEPRRRTAYGAPSHHRLALHPPLELVPRQALPQASAPQSPSLWSELLSTLGLEHP